MTTGAGMAPLSALSRTIKRAATAAGGPGGSGGSPDDAGRCDLCSVPVADGHAHVLDERSGELLCACRACALLFDREAAGRGHYRLVRGRRIRLTGVPPGQLGVPVGLAFFVRQPDGTVMAHYPSPLGVTRWETDPAVWESAVRRCQELRSMRPAVEALLVNTVHGADEQWLVPIDECYRLAAVVRREWRGLSGGDEVWRQIERFFCELAARGGAAAHGRA